MGKYISIICKLSYLHSDSTKDELKHPSAALLKEELASLVLVTISDSFLTELSLAPVGCLGPPWSQLSDIKG